MAAELEQVESKIAYLERTTAELSDELYRQQQLIEVLRMQIERLIGQIDAAQAEAPRSPELERPPHY